MKEYKPLSEEEERIGKIIVNAAYRVYKESGPGLLEKIYEIALAHELEKAGLNVVRQLDITIIYDNSRYAVLPKCGHSGLFRLNAVLTNLSRI